MQIQKSATKNHYNCLGCGKDFNTYKIYPDGWICLDCRKTATITVKCSVCGTNVPVKWDTYTMKDPSIPWRCRACNDKYRNEVYAAKPEEEKKAFVASQTARSKAYWASLSDDEKKADSQRRKDLWAIRKLNGEAERIFAAMKEGHARWYDSLSPEEKHERWAQMDEGRAIWWASLTQEEKDEHMKFPHEGFRKWYSSLPEDEREAFMEPIHEGNKHFWDGMSREEYISWKVEFNKGCRKYFSNPNTDDRALKPSKNELAFIERMAMEGISPAFQYPTIEIHSDFNKLFPRNPVTGSDKVDPTHFWDFMISTREGKGTR